MPLETEKIPFGMADIYIDEGGTDEAAFDGVANLQAEGGELTLTPSFEPLNIADYGTGEYDDILVAYAGTLTINAAEDSIKNFMLALAATDAITDATSGDVVGATDAAIGTSMRSRAKGVRIHPRRVPKELKHRDIYIYKMASTGEITQTNGNSQSSVQISLKMYPRDGMQPDKPGNFFYRGGIDPNAAQAPA